MLDEKKIAELNRWLHRQHGVYVARDEHLVWKAAYIASGVGCRLADFRSHVRRVGIDARPHGDGFLLDFSNGRDLVMLGIEP